MTFDLFLPMTFDLFLPMPYLWSNGQQ